MDAVDNKKKIAENENTKMFRSRFDIFVLNALNDESCEGYGYDVVNYIQSKTKGHYKIKTFSTIYNTLKRLEDQKLVISHKGGSESNGAVRIYYSLTDEGRAYLEADKQEYKYLRTLLDNLLTDEEFDLDHDEIPYSASYLKPLTKRIKNDDVDNVADDEVANAKSCDISENIAVNNTETIKNDFPDDEPVISPLVAASSQDSLIVRRSTPKPSNKKYNFDYKVVMEKITKPVLETSKTPKQEQQRIKSPISVYGGRISESTTTANKPVASAVTVTKPKTKSNKEPTTIQKKSNIDEFRNTLRSEGYSLKTYAKNENESGTGMRYIFINRLMRDSILLSCLYLIITLLILFLCKKTFEFSSAAIYSIGSVAISIALITGVVWFRKPDKRKKDVINLKVLNAICITAFFVFFMLDLVIALFVPNGYSLNSPQIYAPVIIATTSIFFGIIFSILYKSENYFQK